MSERKVLQISDFFKQPQTDDTGHPDPHEALRLVRAYIRILDAEERRTIVAKVEEIANKYG